MKKQTPPEPPRILQFTIEGIPPSANTYWRHDRGVTHISTEGIEWREFVAIMAPSEQFTGRVFLDIGLWLPDLRRDPDNTIKSMQDSLQYAGVVKNDRQIRRTGVYEIGIDKANPRTVITVGSLELWQQWIMTQIQEVA